jgi:ABC-2 type transport system permease protein
VNAAVIGTILRKDAGSFRNDRFYVLLTAVSIVAYPLLFWLLPSTVEETIALGVTPAEFSEVLGGDEAQAAEGGLAVAGYESSVDLRDAVAAGDLVAGLEFPPDLLAATAAGETTAVTLVLDAGSPPEVTTMLEGLVAEVAYAVAGSPPPVDPRTEVVILGEDRVGNQVALREQLRPLLAFFVLLVETLALATLVASEVQQHTVTAVLVTPATTADFLAAKGILGTGMAFVEVTLIMALIGGLATGAPILLVAMLLGAALVTGFGMIAGSYGRDFMTVLFISMAFMIPLMIPGFAALFPGTASVWVRAIPSWPLVDTIVRVTTQGAGWSDVAGSLLLLLAWCVAAFAAGVVILGRRVARL